MRVYAGGPDTPKWLRHSRRGILRAGQREKVSRCPTGSAAAHLGALVADARPVGIGAMKRAVDAELEVEITEPTTSEIQIAAAPHPNTRLSERLSFVLDGNPVEPSEISGMHGTRIHKMEVPAGYMTVDYAASIV